MWNKNLQVRNTNLPVGIIVPKLPPHQAVAHSPWFNDWYCSNLYVLFLFQSSQHAPPPVVEAKFTFVSTCSTMFYSCKTHLVYLQGFGINCTPCDSTAARVRVLKEGSLERLSLTLSLPCRMLNNAQPNPQNNPPWTRDPTFLHCQECECTCGTWLAFREVAAASPADRCDGSFQQHGRSSSFWIY